MSSEPFRKLCNCLVADAEIDPHVAATLGVVDPLGSGSAARVLKGFKDHYGGLWVGGALEVDEAGVHFKPNALNRAVHKGDHALSIPFSSVVNVSFERGFVTSIVAVATREAVVKFRCYGARAVVQRLQGLMPSPPAR